ncbi:hypothetical protein [Asticcacaulis sp. W401b]|uniref:hypothetical protein n=1 Tax=Asticcacaulis sp. W401b TaxID=3388666 RepID=UPI00397108A1
MADYHSPTVIQPNLPLADISPLERLLLGAMFDAEVDGDGLYLCAELSIDTLPFVGVGELRASYAESLGFESRLLAPVQLWLDQVSEAADLEDTYFDFDAHLEEPAYQIMLQDIVRRSATIGYFIIEGAYTCTKMRADGFGGWAGLIHANGIRVESTRDVIERFFGEEKVPF